MIDTSYKNDGNINIASYRHKIRDKLQFFCQFCPFQTLPRVTRAHPIFGG